MNSWGFNNENIFLAINKLRGFYQNKFGDVEGRLFAILVVFRRSSATSVY